jgi:hypothetical protein
MHSIHVFTRSVMLLLCNFLLVACAATPPPKAAPSASTALLMPTPTPTPCVPTPTLIPPLLGPVPQNCPVSNPTPHMSLPGLGPVIGASPVWADWPGGPVIAHLSPTKSESSTYLAPYGWAMLKTIWEVGPNYTHPVTVRGHDLFDHTPLLFQFDDTPVADAVLDAQHPNHPWSVIGEGWAEWGSDFVVPKAGCYVVDVSWPAGHWSVTFAAGT